MPFLCCHRLPDRAVTDCGLWHMSRLFADNKNPTTTTTTTWLCWSLRNLACGFSTHTHTHTRSTLYPIAQTILLRDAVVAPTGAVFNRWLFLRTTRWYYTLPSVHRRLQGPRLPAAVSLVMTWSDSFQHFVMDTLTKVRPRQWGEGLPAVRACACRLALCGACSDVPLAWHCVLSEKRAPWPCQYLPQQARLLVSCFNNKISPHLPFARTPHGPGCLTHRLWSTQ